MKKITSIILFLTMVFSMFSICASALPEEFDNIFYVSPTGNDYNTGTSIDKPLKSLATAKNHAVNARGNVAIILRGGTYTLKGTTTFSGKSSGNITVKAYNDEKVIFQSGYTYTGFEKCTVNGVTAFKKNVGKYANLNVLANDETTLKRTRYPESGYLYVKSVADYDNLTRSGEVHDNYVGFTADKTKLQTFKNQSDVVVRLLHYWKDEMSTITGYDESDGHISLSRPTSMRIEKNNRFFLENVFEALNEPGEWYFDKSEGYLYYVPFEGEEADTLTLYGPTVETMFKVSGCDNVNFEGITFRCNTFNIPRDNKYADLSSQAAYDAKPCVSYENSRNSHITNCEFRDIGGCAVFFGSGVQDAEVNSCVFKNIGAQAVYIKGENLPIDNSNVTKNITIKNNIIDGYGKNFYNAVGVLVIHANSIDVLNNEIHDGYYTAISVGWVWGYAYSVTYNNHICDNLIYDIGQGWLSDMGGIYTLGIQEGTVLSGNVIHNVAADPEEGGYGGWGIYLDEGSSKILVEKNLVFACGSDSYHLHYGSYNTVRNNIFALSGESQVRITSAYSRIDKRMGGKISAQFSNNILLSDGGVCTYSHACQKDAFTDDSNIFWDYELGKKVRMSKDTPDKKTLSVEKAENSGYLNNAIIADPMFKDAKNYDFTILTYSPITLIDFEKWDYQNAGTIKGTTIGYDTDGGMTAYNDGARDVALLTKAKTPFEPFTALARFFVKIYDWFVRF